MENTPVPAEYLEWLSELETRLGTNEFDPSDWREYFDRGLTVVEALDADSHQGER